MKFIKNTLVILLATSCFIGCNSQNKTSRNGIEYTVLREGDGKAATDGEVLIMHLSYKDKATDSLWADSGESGAQMFAVTDSIWMAKEKDLQVIFGEMKAGDSVTFDITVGEFFENTVGAPAPPGLDPSAVMQFNVACENVFSEEEAMAWQQDMANRRMREMQAEAEKQFEVDVDLIENYLSENSITTERTESGVYYEILEKGSGEKPTNGSTIRVDYAGRLLSGELFDTSIEEVARETNTYNEQRAYEPFEFVLGQGDVIKGWDEGLLALNEGDKARLYIPSTLAYGPRQRSAVIGPNSILVFDVELVEIK